MKPFPSRLSTLAAAIAFVVTCFVARAEPPPVPDAAPAAGTAPLPVSDPVLAGAPAVAEGPVPAAAATDPNAAATPRHKSQNATINLINRLVERGVLTKEDATELIQQAEADAAEARAQASAVEAMQSANPPPLFSGNPPPPSAAAPLPPSPPSFGERAESDEDTVRVTYIPETVKAQLREEIRTEVMDRARDEHWATPHSLPEWTSTFRFFGDVRFRYEGDYFPEGNDNTGAFPNFNAINTGAPFDITGTTFSPQLNVDQDRQRFRLRVRFGTELNIGDGFSGGIRIATGENNSPVTTNQSLGSANGGQGGNFSKYAIWLDRGFVKWQPEDLPPASALALTLGRFDNPFFSTETVWDDDLGFDGGMVQAKLPVGRGVTPFLTLGGFPVFNTDFNFSSNRPDKFASDDKWLLAGQIGASWRVNKNLSMKLGVAYYDFENIEGRLSDPFVPLTASDQGNTDDTRPAFAQKGNTYFPLRNILPVVENNFGTTKQYQYFGLATPFRDLAVTGSVNWDRYEPFHVSIIGEYINNLAFDRASIDSKAINNRGPDSPSGDLGAFVGGDTAWFIGLKVGSAALEKRWDWIVGMNYRYVESDAVVDGFNDSDFGLGGTNLKGYSLYGNLALSPHVFVGLRWLSANEVSGPRYSSDVFQLDFNAKF